MLEAIYSAVILAATSLGAFVGLGGGVIIKPVLDFIGKEPRMQVDFLSAMAVFTMSVVSTGKYLKKKQKYDIGIILFIAAGSIIGGYLGSAVMDFIGGYVEQQIIRCVQAFTLAVLLAAVSVYVGKCSFSFHIKNKASIMVVGLVLGFFASFLGIGGGPINVAVLTLFFSMSVKESAVYSVAIIFFSQLSKLITIFATAGFEPYAHQCKTLIFILPAAVIGGIIGSSLNRKTDDKIIRKIFVAVMISLVALNIYNGISVLVR
ncbi:MAG: sulfite exporter TauE/SafE family protein [Clostridia bacterium]|nr:sulfite exporter TauE/SafE family protein [Clostridia bacterium]